MMVSNTWKTASDDKWYYLNPDGTMAKDQWVVWKDELYRVTEDGSMFEGSICPVSYTHLDVYKRQGLGPGGRRFESCHPDFHILLRRVSRV